MIGGIYCESNLGPIYQEKTLLSARQKFKKLIGTGDILPKGESINEQIINYFYDDVSRRMSKILNSWTPPVNRGYYNRTVDLTRSICLGVYNKGVLRRMYRFTGGRRERGLFTPSDLGTNTSSSATYRMEMLGKSNHPDPAERAQQFLKEYDPYYGKDFSLVIAATMPYAARLEIGYRLPVLKLVVDRMLAGVYDFKKRESGVYYGYVFDRV
jgi:hypothetical protein